MLHVIHFHYIRDSSSTEFPRLRGLLPDEFRQQVRELKRVYEMATLESSIAFLAGNYRASRDLCLLTFDDGLKDHFIHATPILADQGIQGLFFLITSCLEERRIVAVHKNHLLAASRDFSEYRTAFCRRLTDRFPNVDQAVSADDARATYRWDTDDVAAFKYLLNFVLPPDTSGTILDDLFADSFGDDAKLVDQMYVTWQEARDMQAAGMVVGGHTHRHRALSSLPVEEQQEDIDTCARLLQAHLGPQLAWPFAYPYGKLNSFGDTAVRALQKSIFGCAFSTLPGGNEVGHDHYAIRRVDTRQISGNPRM